MFAIVLECARIATPSSFEQQRVFGLQYARLASPTASKMPADAMEVEAPVISEEALLTAVASSKVRAQSWDRDTINDLAAGAAELTRAAEGMSQVDFRARAEGLLRDVDVLACAARAADAAIGVAAAEQTDVRSEAERLESVVKSEEGVVKELRGVLMLERKREERRKHYRAISKIVDEEPTKEDSLKQLQGAQRELEVLQREADGIAERRNRARSEFALLLQCLADLEVVADDISAKSDRDVAMESK